MSKLFVLSTDVARRRAAAAVAEAEPGSVVKLKPPGRTLDQNSAQWPLLEAFSRQLEWPVDGRMVKMDAEDWKHVLTAAFKQQAARVAMGLDGGVVMLGARTSKMSKAEFSEWLEFLHATAADRGVDVGDKQIA